MDVGTLSVVLLFYILLFHFLIDALGILIWMLSQIVDNLHVDRYWVLYQVPVCDMGYFSITVWGGTSTFLDGYLGSNLQMWKFNDFMDCFTSYNIFKTTFFLLWKKKWLMFITLPSKLAMLVYVAGLLIWSDGLFIFWTYHTPHMISIFLCSRILGTLICI